MRTEVISLRALNRATLERRLLRFLAADAATYRHDVGLEAL